MRIQCRNGFTSCKEANCHVMVMRNDKSDLYLRHYKVGFTEEQTFPRNRLPRAWGHHQRNTKCCRKGLPGTVNRLWNLLFVSAFSSEREKSANRRHHGYSRNDASTFHSWDYLQTSSTQITKENQVEQDSLPNLPSDVYS
jgi:hypothetical protein